MVWHLEDSSKLSMFLDTSSKLVKERIDLLKGVNLKKELAGASPIQKMLIHSTVKYHLNKFYSTSDEEKAQKFSELKLVGTTFEKVMIAPELELNHTPNAVLRNIFGCSQFDSLLTGKSDNSILSQESQTQNLCIKLAPDHKCYSGIQKIILSMTILFEPELILNINETPVFILRISNGDLIAPTRTTFSSDVIEQCKSVAYENIKDSEYAYENIIKLYFPAHNNLQELYNDVSHIKPGNEIEKLKLEIALEVIKTKNPYIISDKLSITCNEGNVELIPSVTQTLYKYLSSQDILQLINIANPYDNSSNDVSFLGDYLA